METNTNVINNSQPKTPALSQLSIQVCHYLEPLHSIVLYSLSSDIDFFIGAPREQHHRIATFQTFDPNSALLTSLQDWETFTALWELLFFPDEIMHRSFNNPKPPPDCVRLFGLFYTSQIVY